MKIGIVSNSTFTDYKFFKEHLLFLCKDVLSNNKIHLLTGWTYASTDLSERFCVDTNYKISVYKSDYKKHKSSSSQIKNSQLIADSEILIIFKEKDYIGFDYLYNKKPCHIFEYEKNT